MDDQATGHDTPGREPPDVDQIRAEVKRIIAQVSGLAVEEIGDSARLVDDLDLDSLSLMEIGVDVDYAYRLGLAEERLQEAKRVGHNRSVC